MSEASRRSEVLTTLKAVNNAIMATRLYPPNSPQIPQNIERSYQALKLFLRQHGIFVLTKIDNVVEVAGGQLSKEELKSLGNFMVLSQMELLGLPHMIIVPDLDRDTHEKFLELFCAKNSRIKKEGGGRTLATHLGVVDFFPQQMKKSILENQRKLNAKANRKARETNVPKEYVYVLMGHGGNSAAASRVGQLMFSANKGSLLLSLAITELLERTWRKGSFALITGLSDVFVTAARFTPKDNQEKTAQNTAKLLISQLTRPLRALLFCQHLNDPFGEMTMHELHRQISFAQFGIIIKELQRRQTALNVINRTEQQSVERNFITTALEELQATTRGQQLLGQKKAKSLLAAGEKTRRTQRMQAGLTSLLQGNTTVLQSEEFCDYLPYIVQKLNESGRHKEISAIVKILAQQINTTDIQEHVARCLIAVTSRMMTKNQFHITDYFTPFLIRWFQQEKEAGAAWKDCCALLQRLMLAALKQDQIDKVDSILEGMYSACFQEGTAATATKKEILAKCQDQAIDRHLLEKLLERYLATPNNDASRKRITRQGSVVARFLIAKLSSVNNRDKELIIKLLAKSRWQIAPFIEERLEEPMPWSEKQTLLKLLASHGNSSHIPLVLAFLDNDNTKIQQAALNCLYAISGKKQKQMLLQALAKSRETLKPRIVRALAKIGDKDVVTAFAEILEDQAHYSEDFRDVFLGEVCQGLGKCYPKEAENVLKSFLQLRGTSAGKRIGQNVWKRCEEALVTLAQNYKEELRRQAKISKLRKNTISRFAATNEKNPTLPSKPPRA